jgi:hypothetical protein
LDAVEQGHVVDVSDEAIRPSPGLVDMIEQLARQLHPEAFSEDRAIRPNGNKSQTTLASLAAARIADRCAECAL